MPGGRRRAGGLPARRGRPRRRRSTWSAARSGPGSDAAVLVDVGQLGRRRARRGRRAAVPGRGARAVHPPAREPRACCGRPAGGSPSRGPTSRSPRCGPAGRTGRRPASPRTAAAGRGAPGGAGMSRADVRAGRPGGRPGRGAPCCSARCALDPVFAAAAVGPAGVLAVVLVVLGGRAAARGRPGSVASQHGRPVPPLAGRAGARRWCRWASWLLVARAAHRAVRAPERLFGGLLPTPTSLRRPRRGARRRRGGDARAGDAGAAADAAWWR